MISEIEMNGNFTVEFSGNDTVISCDRFSPAESLDCGQAFRWVQNGSGWHGVAGGISLDIEQKDGKVILKNTGKELFESFWRGYFDLDRDYESLCRRFAQDESLSKAIEFCGGIRILHQEPWEALCSFIISQNNNIPRIKGIIERLCTLLGEKLESGDYAFPTPQAVAAAGVEGLAPIRAGFRAKYMVDAAEKIVNGEINLNEIEKMPIDLAEEELKKIKGVGPKVAQCALLYGFGRQEAFPIDVWVKRILAELYPEGLPECVKGSEGIAQQYLFHWRRTAF